jgi:hypothetical protein
LLIEDLTQEADSETATLAWLVDALEHKRSAGQTKAVWFLNVTRWVEWVCPVSTDCLPLSYSTSSQSNLFVL